MDDYIVKKNVPDYLEIDQKEFDNYFSNSGEIIGEKIRGRWYFKKSTLDEWKKKKLSRTINLGISEYEKCFEFAIKMVYGGLSLHGIRGQRSEVQGADDVILGILAEYALKRFLDEKFQVKILLDEEVHTSEITPQDIDRIIDDGHSRIPKLGVGIKASKMKNAFLILGANEVEFESRVSDVYIFARVGLPSDHLFRILRDHSFFKTAKDFLEQNEHFKKINELKSVPVWICGFTYKEELEKVTSIPGQDFTKGHRYVKSVGKLHNNDSDWIELLNKL